MDTNNFVTSPIFQGTLEGDKPQKTQNRQLKSCHSLFWFFLSLFGPMETFIMTILCPQIVGRHDKCSLYCLSFWADKKARERTSEIVITCEVLLSVTTTQNDDELVV